mmetsp:Transcript_3920/g.9115  ORF Transcript_3920/g.9115 Transcript_3920/m.9115 type:complete len:107 (+) Transcript_3920:413-733(+)
MCVMEFMGERCLAVQCVLDLLFLEFQCFLLSSAAAHLTSLSHRLIKFCLLWVLPPGNTFLHSTHLFFTCLTLSFIVNGLGGAGCWLGIDWGPPPPPQGLFTPDPPS